MAAKMRPPALLLAIGICILMGTNALAYDIERYDYTACLGRVPIRAQPDMNAVKRGTIPEGAAVKMDARNGKWIRVIYKEPRGYFIGWSLETLLCPVKR